VLVLAACAPRAGLREPRRAPPDPIRLIRPDTITVNGQRVSVLPAGGYIDKKTGAHCTVSGPNCVFLQVIPVGPTWFSGGGKFVLGADGVGRDVAVRLLYGGRNSLIVGIGSTAI